MTVATIAADWENERTYASLTITFGRMLGKAFGGDSQVYIKPQILDDKNRMRWKINGEYENAERGVRCSARANRQSRSVSSLMRSAVRVVRGISMVFTLAAMCALASGCAHGNSVPVPQVSADSRVIDIDWQWVRTVTAVERIDVAEPERYTLFLTADGRAEIRVDCNRGGGNYELIGNQLTFGKLVTTRRACAPDSQDSIFLSQLERVTSFFVKESTLYLEMPMDSGTMRFEPAKAVEMPGTP